mmetsp:Transcript_7691/g.20504  ORF Transcript_7691/g.20504 Transcript_7691/m.20504 type:complete len:219 (-) Transcript_7691:2365-3021(-)
MACTSSTVLVFWCFPDAARRWAGLPCKVLSFDVELQYSWAKRLEHLGVAGFQPVLLPPFLSTEEEQLLFCTSGTHIGKPLLLLIIRREPALIILASPLVWAQAVFKASHKNSMEFQAFAGVQCHEAHTVQGPIILSILQVAHQRGMFQKLAQGGQLGVVLCIACTTRHDSAAVVAYAADMIAAAAAAAAAARPTRLHPLPQRHPCGQFYQPGVVLPGC